MAENKVQEYKVTAVAELQQLLETGKDFFFTEYRGMTVEQISNLRRKLRETSAEYKVVKNNFAKIAFKNLGNDGVESYFVGPTAVAISSGADSGAVAKALLDFGKEAPVLLRGGLVEGMVFDKNQVEAFSKLPSRTQLIGMLMGTMQAPLQNFVFALNGVTSKLVRTLQAVADQKAGN